MLQETRKPGRPKNPALEARRSAEILEAAAKVFAERGFANTQVQEIADRLGIGNGTVYRYFPTKDKLFIATVEKGLHELSEAMDRVLATPFDPIRQLELAILEYLRFFHRRPEMAELFIQERAAFPQNPRALYFTFEHEEERCKHAAYFDRLIATGKVRAIPMERLFAVLGDLLYGAVLTNLLADRRVEPDALAADILDVILHGLLAPEPVEHPAKKGKKP
jgi:AcrR family transcriptional regulator